MQADAPQSHFTHSESIPGIGELTVTISLAVDATVEQREAIVNCVGIAATNVMRQQVAYLADPQASSEGQTDHTAVFSEQFGTNTAFVEVHLQAEREFDSDNLRSHMGVYRDLLMEHLVDHMKDPDRSKLAGTLAEQSVLPAFLLQCTLMGQDPRDFMLEQYENCPLSVDEVNKLTFNPVPGIDVLVQYAQLDGNNVSIDLSKPPTSDFGGGMYL